MDSRFKLYFEHSNSNLDEEQSILTPQGIITTCLFKEQCSRYWRVSILEIPFTSFSLSQFITSCPDYTCGTPEKDSPTIPVGKQISIPGPSIQFVDVYGHPVYPCIPPPSLEVWSCNTAIQTLRLWSSNLVLFTSDQHVLFVNYQNNSLYRIESLYLAGRIAFIHPTVGLYFVSNVGSFLNREFS